MSDPTLPEARAISRRSVLKALGTGAGAVALVPWLSEEGLLAFTELQRKGAPPQPRVLPAVLFATLETLVEAIIPADERSPGAREARVADYIDLLLSESDATLQRQWIGGLEAVDAEATARFRAPFARLDEAQTEELMAHISGNERAPETPLQKLFAMAKQATIHGYYTSEVGIHNELQYKGNRMLAEFVGCTTVDGQDCPHCGQKAQTPHAG